MTSNKLLMPNLTLLGIFIFGTVLWVLPIPEGVSAQAWHLFIIFLATIGGIILNPLPMGVVALFSITLCIVTKTLTLAECLGGFADKTVWLIVFAFFISHGFIKTGLGSRIAYMLISILGKSTLGLAYSLVFSDFALSAGIPSVTARGGGIIFPVASSLCKSYSDETHPGVSSRNGGFLMKICAQSSVITSAMFLTAMAANPVAVGFAQQAGVTITWGSWALAAIVPGLLCLIAMPLVVYFLYPPAMKHSDSAPALAQQKLKEMGPMSGKEKTMLLIFFLLIGLWIFGENFFGIDATSTALIGLCFLLLFRVINFEETIGDKGAWHTFVWFATLLMISNFLAKFGVMAWLGNKLEFAFSGFTPVISVVLLSLVYFYVHYIFASATAHISVLLPTFLIIFIGAGIPPIVAALMLIFLSVLSSGLTHFGLSSTPIFFNAGYIKAQTWWFIGFILSLVYIAIWAVVGAAWWKVIGLW